MTLEELQEIHDRSKTVCKSIAKILDGETVDVQIVVLSCITAKLIALNCSTEEEASDMYDFISTAISAALNATDEMGMAAWNRDNPQ